LLDGGPEQALAGRTGKRAQIPTAGEIKRT